MPVTRRSPFKYVGFFGALAFLLVFCATAKTIDTPKPKLAAYKIENKERVPLETTIDSSWNWHTNDEGARVLSVRARLRSDYFSRFQEVKIHSEETTAALNQDSLTIEFFRTTEAIILQNASTKIPVVITLETDSPVIDDTCKRSLLVLRSLTPPPDFPIGLGCKSSKNLAAFTLSFPRDVELNSSTLFETKGKGEPWRYYELQATQRAPGEIGRVSFKKKDKEYEFALEILRAGIETTSAPASRVALIAGAGYGGFSISGPDIDVSDPKPTLSLRVPHLRVWKGLGFGLNLHIGIPLSSSPSTIHSTQIDTDIAYEIPVGSILKIRPFLGYAVFSQSHEETQIGVSANEILVGGAFDFSMADANHFSISAMRMGFGSSVIKSHYGIDFTYARKHRGSWGWGIGLRVQHFTLANDLGVERVFGSPLLFAGVVL
jgi:hypothetical protein